MFVCLCNFEFSPNQAAMSTKISMVVLFRLRSYSTKWKENFVPLLTHSSAFAKVHIEKSDVIVNSIIGR